MHRILFEPVFSDWQSKARNALRHGWTPESIDWQDCASPQAGFDFNQDSEEPKCASPAEVKVPREFLQLAEIVARHSAADRWPLLYRILWRIAQGERDLLENPVDADGVALRSYEKQVRKDAYRITAFVRFREVQVEGKPWLVAWHEPEHDSLELAADFFTSRFANVRWSILTPRRCMHWDGRELQWSDGTAKSSAPKEDGTEALWVAYYSRIFNPARLNLRAMQAQLLKRNWKNLPEAAVIEELTRSAPPRVQRMLDESEFRIPRDSDFSTPQIPPGTDWNALRNATASCRACPLWKHATCSVFGEGPRDTKVVLVGEQPGDQEDRAGKPFVGPAGLVLNRALAAAGIIRSEIYVTNAVKHFKFEPRGKRRLHKTASPREIAACRPWLEAELALLRPKLVVALGGTACQSLIGAPIPVLQNRGTIREIEPGRQLLITVHPSSLLRLPAGTDAEAEFMKFVEDLRKIRQFLAE